MSTEVEEVQTRHRETVGRCPERGREDQRGVREGMITSFGKCWHEGELIKIIVSKVLLILKVQHLNVTDKFVAIDDHVENIMRVLNVDSADVRILGIHRLGDIGKRLSQRVIYNRLSARFEYCSFIADILQTSQIRGLKYLQNQFEQLESLVQLDLSNSGIIELPDSISNMKNLKAEGQGKLLGAYQTVITHEQIPSVNGMLENLEEIHAKGCNRDGKIPDDIGDLSHLQILSLSSNGIKCLSETVSRLLQLQTLELESCKVLRGLPELPSSLISLRVSSQFMETIPDLSNLVNLRNLYLSDGSHLKGFPTDYLAGRTQNPAPEWIGMLSKLETLQLSLLKITTLQGNMGLLPQLKKIILSCVDLQTFEELPSSLSTLYIGNCKSMAVVPDISNLINQTQLELLHSAISEIQGLEGLKSLQDFDVIYCRKLRKIDGLEGLESVRRLVLRNCKSLERLPNLSNLKKLKKLKVGNCDKLLEIPGLDTLEPLEELKVLECRSIERFPDITNLKKLRDLEIRNCNKIGHIPGLNRLECLEELQISECTSLEKLPDLSNLKKLIFLEIESCEKISNIEGLNEQESLEHLRVIGCKSIEKLPDLSNFKRLKYLYIEDCERIHDIVGLGILRSIKGDDCF